MKKSELRQLIKEEVSKILNKENYNEFMDSNYPGFKPEGEQSFIEFVHLVAKNIFRAGVNDPTMADVSANDWGTLFEYWEDFGDLDMHTKSDIISLAKKTGVSKNNIMYILDLPQVSKLERG